jgi:DNA-binding transcriptional regulator YdaS (Cro superfamily)
MEALDAAIGDLGVTAFAARIGVAQSTVSMWKARGRVPAEACPAIERETGVRCERLRPDVPWEVLRLQCADPAGVA